MEKATTKINVKKYRSASGGKKEKIDLMAYCGILKLKEDPLTIQKRLRDEWE